MSDKEFEIVHHTAANDIEIFLVEMTARKPHGHDDLELGILLKGNVTLFTENEQLELKQGDIYVINRYQIHSFVNTRETNCILAFQIRSEFYRRLNYQLNFIHFNVNIIRSGPLHDQLYRLLTAAAAAYFETAPYFELQCAAILLELLHTLITTTKPVVTDEKIYASAQNNSRRLNRIVDYIADHHVEHITLEDIAAMENITVYHASHTIKALLGVSFQEYLAQVRFEQALRLVATTRLNILDICLECGFSSSRYMNQTFEKNLGCSVKEYRRMEKKPVMKAPALPASNIQERYTFEKAAFILSRFIE